MTDRPHPELARLLAALADDQLTPDEGRRLAELLRDDPAARTHYLQLQELTAHLQWEYGSAALQGELVSSPWRDIPPDRWLSRRRVLGALAVSGSAAAIGAAIGTVGWWGVCSGRRPVAATLLRSAGRVLVRSELASIGTPLFPGDCLSVEGIGSWAVFGISDGSEVMVAGESSATLASIPQPQFMIHEGGVSADVVARGPESLTLATREATAVAGAERTRLTLGRFSRGTEVRVLEGLVRVSQPGGPRLLEIHTGEVGFVMDGAAQKQPRPILGTDYAWDLTQPLPAGWEAGWIEDTPDGPVVVSTRWPGNKYTGPAYMVRSDNGWTTGFVALHPDSVVTLRYRVAKPGPVQLFVVVRPEVLVDSTAMVFDVRRSADENTPGQWHTIQARLEEMGYAFVPKVGALPPPWVAYTFGVNTYQKDLGLQVAELRVTRPR